jgi:NSS family neurotransmitter:Na+ symporter
MENWQSRSTFVFALAAAAVGLGNVWRFAYLLGENGGAPFMLAYLLSLLTLAVPVLAAEVALGGLGRGSPLQAIVRSARRGRRSRLWAVAALPAYLAALLMLIIALVLASWCLRYAFHHQLGSFAAISLGGTRTFFEQSLTEPLRSLGWLLLAALPLVLTGFAGLRRGLGLALWLCIPTIIVLLAVVIDFALRYGDLEAAGQFLFARQPLDFSDRSFLLAAGQAFFTLGIGFGVGITFGARAPEGVPIVRSVLAVALFDVVVAVAMGVAIFPLLFANNLAPAQGFGLLFIALPYAFGNLGLGDLFGALFFFCVFVVILATALALLEPLTSQLRQFGLRRSRAAMTVLAAVAMVAAHLLYTMGDGSGLKLLTSMERLTTGLLLPLTALLLTLFCGWRLPRSLLRRSMAREPDSVFSLWYFLLRFWVPPALIMLWLALRITEVI